MSTSITQNKITKSSRTSKIHSTGICRCNGKSFFNSPNNTYPILTTLNNYTICSTITIYKPLSKCYRCICPPSRIPVKHLFQVICCYRITINPLHVHLQTCTSCQSTKVQGVGLGFDKIYLLTLKGNEEKKELWLEEVAKAFEAIEKGKLDKIEVVGF